MGCMGMSMMDFCLCTPSEFYETWKVWNEMQLRREREAWERARMECLCTLQPWSKKRLKVQDVMQLPWDEMEKGLSGKAESTGAQRELNHEELMARYRAAKKRMGL